MLQYNFRTDILTRDSTDLTSSLVGSHWALSSSLVRVSFPSRRRRWRSGSMRARVSARCWWWSWRRVTWLWPSMDLSSDMMATRRRPHTWHWARKGSTSWWTYIHSFILNSFSKRSRVHVEDLCYLDVITVSNKTEKGILHNTVHNITNDILCSLLSLLVICLST